MLTYFVFLVTLLGAHSAAIRDKKTVLCALPPFTDNLPQESKNRVVDIWSNYKGGTDCESERKETKEVLASLDAVTRNRVLFNKGPAFLKGASPDVRKQFEDLWKDDSIPRIDKPEKFSELAQKVLTAQQLMEFKKFHENMVKRRDEFQKKLGKLTPEARAAHEKLTELRDQRHQVYKNASESVRAELNNLYRFDDDHDLSD